MPLFGGRPSEVTKWRRPSSPKYDILSGVIDVGAGIFVRSERNKK